jgi:branched-chain amino acid transport system substrate-binding protein
LWNPEEQKGQLIDLDESHPSPHWATCWQNASASGIPTKERRIMTDTHMASDRTGRFPEEPGTPRIDRRGLIRGAAVAGGVIPATRLLLAAVASAQGTPVATPEQIPIRIGATLAATGAYAATAPYLKEAYLLWEAQQNAAGGLLGRPVKMVIYDDESDPETSASLYERLITEDKVDLVLGPYSSNVSLAVIPVIEQHGQPLLLTGASSLEIWKSDPQYAFGVFSIAQDYFKDIAGTIAPAQGYTTAVVIYGDAVFPLSTGKGAVAHCQAAGIEVVLEEAYPQQETDFGPLLTRISDAKPDMILVGSYLPDSILILQQAKELDVSADLFAFSVGVALPDFQEALGADVNGVLGPSMWEPTIPTPGNAEFVAAYEEMWHQAPAYHSALGFAGCQVLAQAVTTVGRLDLDAIRDQLHAMTMHTVLPGEYKVDATGKSIGHIPLTVQWQNEEKVIVSPDDLKTGALQLPMTPWAERG